jgi:hypothetical protein
MGWLMQDFRLPIKTAGGLNAREHWSRRHRRAKDERRTAYLLTSSSPLPCVVLLIRESPRTLDGDNLQGVLKAVRDGIADRLGVDDADARVEWRYDQAKVHRQQAGVRVVIRAKGES